jgi:hypothetical protein
MPLDPSVLRDAFLDLYEHANYSSLERYEEAVRDLFEEDYRYGSAGGGPPVVGLEPMLASARAYRVALAPFVVSIDSLLIENAKVSIKYTASGVFSAQFPEDCPTPELRQLRPTKAPVRFSGLWTGTVLYKTGKVMNGFGAVDSLALMAQLVPQAVIEDEDSASGAEQSSSQSRSV